MSGKVVGSFVLLLCAMILLTALPAVLSAQTDQGVKVFIEEGGEEATYDEWNNRWPMRYDSNNDPASSQDWWCRQMHEVHSGLRSIYCARNGFNSHYKTTSGHQPWNVNLTSQPDSVPQTSWVLRYDTNQDSIMRKEVLGARYYNTVTMTFWFYSDTGTSDAKQPDSGAEVGYDFLNAIYYTGSGDGMEKHVLWTDSYAQATSKTWSQITLDVPNEATWIGLEFVSGTIAPEGGDPSNAFSAEGISVVNGGMKEGVFLDDIKVVGSDPAPDVPLVTSVASLPAYQGNRSFPVYIDDNGPQVGLKYTYLYYRLAGELNWTRYVTAENPGGTFSAFPIDFSVDGDGTYELFSAGVDQHDVAEEVRNSADARTVVDTVDPSSQIAVDGARAGDAYDGTASFTINATDAASGVDHITYRIDGGEWMTYAGSFGLSTNGAHSVEYFATDRAGNAEEVKSVAATIVNGAYGIVFQDLGDLKDGDFTIAFTVVAGSAISKLEYSVDGGQFLELDPNASSLSLTGLDDGEHTVTVRATGSDGGIVQGELDFSVGQGGSGIGGFLGDIVAQPLALIALVVSAVAVIGAVWFIRKRK